jgi:hypothetical protein
LGAPRCAAGSPDPAIPSRPARRNSVTVTRRIRARCPRDHGRLVLEKDPHGTYLSCLCCGYVLEEQTRQRPDARPLPAWWRDQPACPSA